MIDSRAPVAELSEDHDLYPEFDASSAFDLEIFLKPHLAREQVVLYPSGATLRLKRWWLDRTYRGGAEAFITDMSRLEILDMLQANRDCAVYGFTTQTWKSVEDPDFIFGLISARAGACSDAISAEVH